MALALRSWIWSRARVSLAFLLLALALLPLADLEISSPEPWRVLGRFFSRLLSPRFSAVEDLLHAVSLTLAFALVGVAAGACAGFLLMLAFHHAAVRGFCAAIRAVHEVFWALIFLQMLGPAPLTGVLAIAVPYTGIFPKVFHEMVEEADRAPAAALPVGVPALAAMFYARLPLVRGTMRIYALYRVECGLRSSAVLGFVGLPTLGFQLDTFFKQGAYDACAALLLIFYALIATVRLWCRLALLPLYLVAALVLLAGVAAPPADPANILRFLAHDIVPAPLRDGGAFSLASWARFGDWAAMLVACQALPGLAATLVVTIVAVAAMGMVALAAYPLLVTRIVGPAGRFAGHVVLVVVRSTPELMLAYLCLQIFGPSMLPAILALGLHNGAIIAHLLGRRPTPCARAPTARVGSTFMPGR